MQPLNTTRHNILVVEDNDDSYEIMELMLRKIDKDINITRAKTITELKSVIDITNFDCILLDLTLPINENDPTFVKTGQDVFIMTKEMLGLTENNKKAKIIVITADMTQQNELLIDGAEDFLIKGSYTIEDLRRAISFATLPKENPQR